jgi:hypothetical protein
MSGASSKRLSRFVGSYYSRSFPIGSAQVGGANLKIRQHNCGLVKVCGVLVSW